MNLQKLGLFLRHPFDLFLNLFGIWLDVLKGVEHPNMFFDMLQFFQVFEQDFFDWYSMHERFDH